MSGPIIIKPTPEGGTRIEMVRLLLTEGYSDPNTKDKWDRAPTSGCVAFPC